MRRSPKPPEIIQKLTDTSNESQTLANKKGEMTCFQTAVSCWPALRFKFNQQLESYAKEGDVPAAEAGCGWWMTDSGLWMAGVPVGHRTVVQEPYNGLWTAIGWLSSGHRTAVGQLSDRRPTIVWRMSDGCRTAVEWLTDACTTAIQQLSGDGMAQSCFLGTQLRSGYGAEQNGTVTVPFYPYIRISDCIPSVT